MSGKFLPAKRAKVNLSLILAGPAGSGKTWTALELASHLSDKVAFIDTEGGSSELYADTFLFDIHTTHQHSPRELAKDIQDAAKEGYGVVVLDSLSHAWEWCLTEVDRRSKNSAASNKFVAWADVTPMWQELMALIQAPPCHLIVTARSKMGYEIVPDENKPGRTKPVRIGLQPIVREQTEYEPQIFATMDNSNGEPVLSIQKTRCAALTGKTFAYPGHELASILKTWAETGIVQTERPAYSKAGNKSPQEKFDMLRDWMAGKAGNAPQDFTDDNSDIWTHFAATCKANSQDENEFFAALFPDTKGETTDAELYALYQWLQGSPDKLAGHIQIWQSLSNGVQAQ